MFGTKRSQGWALGCLILSMPVVAHATPPPPLPSLDPDALPEPMPEDIKAPLKSIVYRSGEIVQPLPKPTRILSENDADRLRTVQGITLQWISWDERGRVSVAPNANGVWRLSGSQLDQSGGGLRLSGTITEIGPDYFLFDGKIEIAGTPDAGRRCEASKLWRFEVTQNRAYYRLREFEWCDGLTDYIDIYFAPSLR